MHNNTGADATAPIVTYDMARASAIAQGLAIVLCRKIDTLLNVAALLPSPVNDTYAAQLSTLRHEVRGALTSVIAAGFGDTAIPARSAVSEAQDLITILRNVQRGEVLNALSSADLRTLSTLAYAVADAARREADTRAVKGAVEGGNS